jgi:hypothetical protein
LALPRCSTKEKNLPDLLALPDDELLRRLARASDEEIAALPAALLRALIREVGVRVGAAIARRDQARAALDS